MSKNDIRLDILNTKCFITGLLALYKIEFIETEDNKYLEVMNELNKCFQLIDYLEKNSLEISKKIKKD